VWRRWVLSDQQKLERPPHWPTLNITELKAKSLLFGYYLINRSLNGHLTDQPQTLQNWRQSLYYLSSLAVRHGCTTTVWRCRWSPWYGSITHHVQKFDNCEQGKVMGAIFGIFTWLFLLISRPFGEHEPQLPLRCHYEALSNWWWRPEFLTQDVLLLHDNAMPKNGTHHHSPAEHLALETHNSPNTHPRID